jgi:hypothetical protein
VAQAGADEVASATKRLRRLLRYGLPKRSEVQIPLSELERHLVDIRMGVKILRCIATVDEERPGVLIEHVSVSTKHRLLPYHHTELATWDELVAIRSIAWDDDEMVHQVMPPLTGPHAEEYVNTAEVLHLRRTR